jgi:outer membrane protein assembly factor BamE (lipoprotein component of BamABCDE complex)
LNSGSRLSTNLPSIILATGRTCAEREDAMRWMLVAGCCAALSGCMTPTTGPVDQRSNTLTQGNVQMNLVVGQTTKSQVLEVFGAPNITTRDGNGQEVWSYQRHATVSQSTSGSNYWTILLAGGSKSASGFQETQRTMTLIIKFDSKDIVSDFRSRASEF